MKTTIALLLALSACGYHGEPRQYYTGNPDMDRWIEAQRGAAERSGHAVYVDDIGRRSDPPVESQYPVYVIGPKSWQVIRNGETIQKCYIGTPGCER